jgi:hypothetical protein
MPNQNPNSGYGYGGYGLGQYGSDPAETLPIGYYLSLITSEYQTSPNFLSWLTSALTILDDGSQSLAGLLPAFDLASATGVQLDRLGVIIGQSRIVGFQPSSGVSPILDDATYRLLLQARIARNQWDGSINSLQTIWRSLFPGGTITIADAQNMTATVVMSGALSSILQDLITNGYIVPRPEGVLYTYTFATLPAFGFDLSNAYVAGFNLGHLA